MGSETNNYPSGRNTSTTTTNSYGSNFVENQYQANTAPYQYHQHLSYLAHNQAFPYYDNPSVAVGNLSYYYHQETSSQNNHSAPNVTSQREIIVLNIGENSNYVNQVPNGAQSTYAMPAHPKVNKSTPTTSKKDMVPEYHNINQKEQNGSFSTFQPWNSSPKNPNKVSNQSISREQNSSPCGGNYENSVQQHQSLMASQLRQPLYISSTVHPCSDNTPTAVNNYNCDTQWTSNRNDNHIPSIEEELSFLCEVPHAGQWPTYPISANPNVNKNRCKTSQNDFAACFLKFIRERDTHYEDYFAPRGSKYTNRVSHTEQKHDLQTNPSLKSAANSYKDCEKSSPFMKTKKKENLQSFGQQDKKYSSECQTSLPCDKPTDFATKDKLEDNRFVEKTRSNKPRSPPLMPVTLSSGLKKRRIEEKNDGLKNEVVKPSRPGDTCLPNVTGDGSELEGEINLNTGEFVALASEVHKDTPLIWRVLGKSLLENYEPFAFKPGVIRYRRINSYSALNNEQNYIKVEVKVHSISEMENIIELLKNNPYGKRSNHLDFMESCVEQLLQYKYNFKVYIQVLISHALTTNSLTEIFEEKDEYFLVNIKTIDDLIALKTNLLIRASKWQNILTVKAITTWPFYNVIFDLTDLEKLDKYCTGCTKPVVDVRLIMSGPSYNNATLENSKSLPKITPPKDLLMCGNCLEYAKLLSKVAHQKYLLFIECFKRVNEMRGSCEKSTDEDNNYTILSELLNDEVWLNKLFKDMCYAWAQIDYITLSTT